MFDDIIKKEEINVIDVYRIKYRKDYHPGKWNTWYMNVLAIVEGKSIVLQALEYDITAQGTGIRKALLAFEKILTSQIALDENGGKKPLENIKHAPLKYWDVFDAYEDEIVGITFT